MHKLFLQLFYWMCNAFFLCCANQVFTVCINRLLCVCFLHSVLLARSARYRILLSHNFFVPCKSSILLLCHVFLVPFKWSILPSCRAVLMPCKSSILLYVALQRFLYTFCIFKEKVRVIKNMRISGQLVIETALIFWTLDSVAGHHFDLFSSLSEQGNECEYRHSEYARVNPRDCRYWLSGNCLNPKCPFRHPVSAFLRTNFIYFSCQFLDYFVYFPVIRSLYGFC